MENLTTLMAICCTIIGAFMLFMPWTGKSLSVAIIKLLGFISLVAAILYWIKMFNLV